MAYDPITGPPYSMANPSLLQILNSIGWSNLALLLT